MLSQSHWFQSALLASAILVVAAGCGDEDTGDDSSGPRIVCDPGEYQQCPCLGIGTGLQRCNAQGTMWGDCEGCSTIGVVDVGDTGAADADTDVDVDTGTGAVQDTATQEPLGECDYNTCTGDICQDVEGCCETAACNSWVYYDTDSFSETYCYPMCDAAAAEPCKCGDVCVDLDTLPVCLKTGNFTMSGLTLTVGEEFDSSLSVETTGMTYSATLGDRPLSLEYVSASWSSWEASDGSIQEGVDIWFDGMADGLSVWILSITIMQETFTRGVGSYAYYDSADDQTINFYADLYYGNLDRNTGDLFEVWIETLPDTDTSVLSIDQTCSLCPIGGTDCTQCAFSFNINWVALRAKLNL